MQRITKKLWDNKNYIIKCDNVPLCLYLTCKHFKKIRKIVNKLGRLEDLYEEIYNEIKEKRNAKEII